MILADELELSISESEGVFLDELKADELFLSLFSERSTMNSLRLISLAVFNRLLKCH
ncbi:hypothetical protein EV13_1864 [Prochlorococcus sp. MIT 0702]|nr:hypothetical protein EV13_1864 [Prochlorococcus sp. MIT 0702]KGG29627.1 hypothetical protein EV12_0036 [Prochlorococcus sp. MIT 0701]KGG34374.1 hypothetical protein EV14_1270 [Prochlorococcus sp. MIT 0703]